MEREVGEIFDYKGKRLQVRKATNGDGCDECFFDQICSTDTFDVSGICDEDARNDGNDVYFKEMNEIMAREEMKDLLPVMQAFADGKTIEYSNDGELWIETATPTWCSDKFYRIKQEPKYRPFKNKEECWNEMLKHQPFGWLSDKDGDYLLPSVIGDDSDFIFRFRVHKFADGAPFGIME